MLALDSGEDYFPRFKHTHNFNRHPIDEYSSNIINQEDDVRIH